MPDTFPISGELIVTPDLFQSKSKLRVRRNNKLGRIELQVTSDGGVTYRTLLPDPASAKGAAKVGSVLTVLEGGGVGWVFPTTPTENNRLENFVHPVSSSYNNTLVVNEVFGVLQVPSTYAFDLIGMAASVQTASSVDDIKVDICTAAGARKNKVLTIGAGVKYASVTYSQSLRLPQGTTWRFKIVQVGNEDQRGEGLTIQALVVPVYP